MFSRFWALFRPTKHDEIAVLPDSLSEDESLEGRDAVVDTVEPLATGVVIIESDFDFDDDYNQINDPFAGADSTVRAKDLARTAVQCKDSDIPKAIKLMEEVVALHPSDKFLGRLAYYYSLANNKISCLATHAERLNRISLKTPKHYFDSKIGILEDARKAHSRFQESRRAILLEAECEFLRKVKKACEGIFSEEELESYRPFKGRILKKDLKILELQSIDSAASLEILKKELVEVAKFYSTDLALMADLARRLEKAKAENVKDQQSMQDFEAAWKRFAKFDFADQIKDRFEGGF